MGWDELDSRGGNAEGYASGGSSRALSSRIRGRRYAQVKVEPLFLWQKGSG